MALRLVLNILGLCGAGAFTGTRLTIALILGAYWKSIPPGEFLDWFSTYEYLLVRMIAIVAVPTAIGVAGSLLLALRSPPARLWWGVSLAALLALAVITVSVHLPMNASFSTKSLPLAEVGPTIDRWLSWHAIRIGLGLLATVAGVLGTTLRPAKAPAAAQLSAA
jgi:hypothetical protein